MGVSNVTDRARTLGLRETRMRVMKSEMLLADTVVQEPHQSFVTIPTFSASAFTSRKFFNDVKVLCLIVTFPLNHKSKALPVAETWGKLCNRILFVSTDTDDKLSTLIVDLPENRSDLWQKTKKAFEWIYQNNLNDYEWFLKADDDTYFHMDNLRGFLKNFSPKRALSIGHKFKINGIEDTYHSGGAGYILSREALKKSRFLQLS
ncbi:hypothetical protein KIN20_017117 [Parelaphostrongylus tenuis]|uniref:N-acetylgalactosaminide beta-1,3-galactosyltransferase n=1 Tax=Parelaphostrongylus tenuis TaxID=148309 RepID=A0AAD5MI56_PARTN|nr:hypothetical protein KIN20_017117 [Parelaphostrongylus tenuis]